MTEKRRMQIVCDSCNGFLFLTYFLANKGLCRAAVTRLFPNRELLLSTSMLAIRVYHLLSYLFLSLLLQKKSRVFAKGREGRREKKRYIVAKAIIASFHASVIS